MTLRAGHACRDITPAPGLTLSGFAARCNQPSTSVDDPLHVRALALEQDGNSVLFLVFDLLALGRELTDMLHAALDEVTDPPRAGRILCCTHTHSAPATITLLGCGIPEPAYWEFLCRQAAEAAREACRSCRPAEMRITAIPLHDASYNRCCILDDGRVAMSQHPDRPIVHAGPTWDILRLVRFDEPDGRPIAALAHWAAHPITVCSQQITADYPGELCRRLSAHFNTPFLYLQGACGNINVSFAEMTRAQMLRNVDGIMAQVQEVAWSAPLAPTPFTIATRTIPLRYAPPASRETLEDIRTGMHVVAETGQGPESTQAMLANILNVAPGQQPPQPLLRHIAATLEAWSARTLAQIVTDPPESRDLAVSVLRCGKLVCCAVAAEVFSETAIALQAATPDDIVLLLGYAAPLVGYLPTAQALAAGGYEAEYAYRFYGHPAPYVVESEQIVRKILSEL